MVPLDRDRRSWDTSLLRPQSHQAYAQLADWHPSLEPLDSVESNSPPHQQSISFGEFPPQQSTDDAVNCSMQLRGSPQSSGVVEGIISDDDGNDETESYWDSVQETYLPIRDQLDPVAESQVSHQTFDAQPVHPPHAVPTTSQQSIQVSEIQVASQPSLEEEPLEPEQRANLPDISIKPTLEDSDTEKVFANIPYNELVKRINTLYEEAVFFQKNLFKVPSGKAGKEFIAELTFWLRQFNQTSKLNKIALKIFMMLPTILLQKPSAKSKAKQHSEALERRLQQWRSGKIDELVREIKQIQSAFKKSQTSKESTVNLSKRFAKLMMEGKVSAALKLLDDKSSSGVLSLTDDVLNELRQKHPEPSPIQGDTLLNGPLIPVPDCFFDGIDEQTILKSAKDTKGSAGPSGMDAEQYR